MNSRMKPDLGQQDFQVLIIQQNFLLLQSWNKIENKQQLSLVDKLYDKVKFLTSMWDPFGIFIKDTQSLR